MRGERAFAIASFENQRRTREIISYPDAGEVTNKLTFMPSAYFYQNEMAFAQCMSNGFCRSLTQTRESFPPQFYDMPRCYSSGEETLFALQNSGIDVISGHRQNRDKARGHSSEH